ncbi:MAG: hypothetical protein ABIZ49_08900 [Opitutaceae bacterium]
MQTTLKLILAVVALGAAASLPQLRAADDAAPPAQTQKGRKAGGARGAGGALNGEQRIAQLDRTLGLSEDQKVKIKDIYTAAQNDVQALPQKDRRTKGRDVLQSTRSQVRAVLTEEQQKKFDTMAAGDPGARDAAQKRRKKGN